MDIKYKRWLNFGSEWYAVKIVEFAQGCDRFSALGFSKTKERVCNYRTKEAFSKQNLRFQHPCRLPRKLTIAPKKQSHPFLCELNAIYGIPGTQPIRSQWEERRQGCLAVNHEAMWALAVSSYEHASSYDHTGSSEEWSRFSRRFPATFPLHIIPK